MEWLNEHGGLSYELSEYTVEDFKFWLTNKYENSTARLHFTVTKKFISWLAERGHIARNTGALVKSIKGDGITHKRDALTAAEVGAIFIKKIDNVADAEKAVAAADKIAADVANGRRNSRIRHKAAVQQRRANTTLLKSLRDLAIIKLLALGLRTIEVARIDTGDMKKQYGRWILRVWGKGRSSKGDIIILPAEARTAILDYLKARGAVKDGEPLFVSTSTKNFGERVQTQTISRLAKRAITETVNDADERILCAHSFRHANATIALESGVDNDSVSKNLRHKNAGVIEVYRHDLKIFKNKTNETVFGVISAEMKNLEQSGDA